MISVNNEEFLWTEKYRPKKLEECILPPDLKATFLSFSSKKEAMNLLLYGPPGTGKTSVAGALMEEMGVEYMFINGSKERNMDVLRNQISDFASSISFSGDGRRKYVIIDEADGLSHMVQPAMKAFIEEVSSNCGFIFTANHVNKIIPALRSRLLEIPFIFNKEDRVAMMRAAIIRILLILKNEGITIDDTSKQIVAALVKRNYPEIRRILNLLQRYTVSGKLDTGILAKIADETFSNISALLKAKDFKGMRAWVTENSDLDMATLVAELDRELSPKILPQSTPAMILVLNKYDYQSAFVANKELNITAMMTELMAEVSFGDE